MKNVTAQQQDPLTQVYTHNVFQERFKEEIHNAERNNGTFSLALIDIDYFEQINNTYGRDIGDEVLKMIPRMLVDKIPEQGKIFRDGADEFVVLLPGIEKEQTFLLFEDLRKQVDQERTFSESEKSSTVTLSISAGIASYPDDGQQGQEILRKAKDAIHRAKMTGRNKVCLAREERMVTKTSHYTHGQLERLSYLAKKEGLGEAVLLREALDDLLRKYDV